MSAKNLLQEYYQKKGLPLPTYETKRIGGSDHSPLFISTVITSDDLIIDSSPKNTRKKSELDAANKAYEVVKTKSKLSDESTMSKLSIKSNNENNKKIIDNVIIYIDIENKPNSAGNILNEYSIEIIGFVSRRHPIAENINDYPCKVIIIPTIVKNGADIGMCMYIANNLPSKDKTIILLTNDNFGLAANDYLNNFLGYKSYNFVNDTEVKNFLINFD